ncbi:YitT family protein [Desulfobotulus mexicanus]|uniref:YitT family protein n=1 Tax=Desulfobotulus mexicanus TaxID=2586642 RepID=A0A5Q4VGC1_9BACT|nr:YitT family protein [Desulfobotulus mexicanus]TYT75988.1 YitT family protein [Desulfobotulus mexicanus]
MFFKRDVSYTVWWNLILITFGAIMYAIAIKGIATPHAFVPGGLFGLASLTYYLTGLLEPGIIFLVLNIPLMIVGGMLLSRRFVLYTIWAILVTTAAFALYPYTIPIEDQLYAAISCGVISGMGAGIVLRSLGSNGGLDIVALLLLQRYNIGLGKSYFAFNLILYFISFIAFDTDLVIASIIMVFVASATMEYSLSMFNQRKVVFIISNEADTIARRVIDELGMSSTLIPAVGAYLRTERQVLMTVINNVQLKKLEEIVFTEDENSLFIVENTFSVMGASFSKRKVY